MSTRGPWRCVWEWSPPGLRGDKRPPPMTKSFATEAEARAMVAELRANAARLGATVATSVVQEPPP